MPDEEAEQSTDTYTPTRTRFEEATIPAPGGGTRTVTYRIRAGTTYTVVPDEDAEDAGLGYAPINNVKDLIRESARP